MNRQGTPQKPFGGIEWTHIFGPRTGYTCNPVKGCKHACRWRMPDGTVAICYAEAVAEKFPGIHYAKGFKNISFDPAELVEIEKLKMPAGIFMDSMSDLFGVGVDNQWIVKTLETMSRAKQHVYFTLTKNPGGLMNRNFPDNALVGISAPPTFMYGKELTLKQQTTWLGHGLDRLMHCEASKRWISIEPLSFEVSEIIKPFVPCLDWAVVGAASNGPKTYQPRLEDLKKVLAALDGKPVFFKGNLDRALAIEAGGKWREEFPPMPNVTRPEEQKTLI